jgi:hypothetical protein
MEYRHLQSLPNGADWMTGPKPCCLWEVEVERKFVKGEEKVED